MKSFLSAVLLLCMAFALIFACACTGAGQKPAETEAPEGGLTQQQEERILRLAKAFDVFGPFDMEYSGLELSTGERMVYCYYTGLLDEAELEGYGRVTIEEAENTLAGVFKGMELPEFIRTKYDPSKDQKAFALNGYYYIRLEPKVGMQYTIKSAEAVEIKDSPVTMRARVEVACRGEVEKQLLLELIPNEEWVYSAYKCGVEYAD